MKTVLATRSIEIPAGVEVSIKARVVYVKGPRGELTRNFKHINMDLSVVGETDDELAVSTPCRSLCATCLVAL